MESTQKTETRKFKAEVKQVLDIVINSLYTHREIFVRELISNASDALEKIRHESLTQDDYTDKSADFEIRIETDKDNHVITVTDTGIGMTHEELVNNLGTIARSGTLEYIRKLAEKNDVTKDMIGKFGVGFYSSFMVANEVHVRTRSFQPSEKGYEWISDGIGKYTITEEENLPRGTSVVIHLKEEAHEFEDENTIKSIIKKYSNFVPFPIFVNGERVNTVQAIWLKSSSEVTDSEYTEFFKFISNSEDDPLYRTHLTSDAPIQLASILYIPSINLEKLGLVKLKPAVNLYSKKILLQQYVENLMPEYMRFVNGVVDSADLSLNISRETIQDNIVFRKLGSFLTKRVIRLLEEEAKKNPEEYRKFWDTFGMFIKEGIVTDFENRTKLTNLLRFNSSNAGKDELVSFKDYTGRLRDDQKAIYYISGRSREEIESGPYTETFRKRDYEVFYLFDTVDDFIMTTLGEYEGKKLVSADSADIELPPEEEKEKEEKPPISLKELENFTAWIKETLGDRVTDVRESKRITDRPALIVNPDAGVTTGMRRFMKSTGRDFMGEGHTILEINTRHSLIIMLKKLRDGKTDKGFLQSCVEQIYYNALAETGLMDDPKTMVDRMYEIMGRAMKGEEIQDREQKKSEKKKSTKPKDTKA